MGVAEILAQIDREIAQLQRARTLLKSGSNSSNGNGANGRHPGKKRNLTPEGSETHLRSGETALGKAEKIRVRRITIFESRTAGVRSSRFCCLLDGISGSDPDYLNRTVEMFIKLVGSSRKRRKCSEVNGQNGFGLEKCAASAASFGPMV